MRYRFLNPDLKVSALGIGCMPLTGFAGGKPMYGAPNLGESMATLELAIDMGVTLFDTAEVYGELNEQLVGRAIFGKRAGLVISTKFGFRFKDGAVHGSDGTPENARRACERSLKNLGVDVIDLFYLHRVDPAVPIEETIGAMAGLVHSGKVRFLGLSEVDINLIRRAQAIHPIAVVESEYSVWERGVEEEVLPLLNALGIGFVPYAPLGRGFLTGRFNSRSDLAEGDYRLTDPRYSPDNFHLNKRIVDTLWQVAGRYDATAAQIALAWLLAQGPGIVPIPGIERRDFLKDNIRATELDISAADLGLISSAFPKGSTAGARYPSARA